MALISDSPTPKAPKHTSAPQNTAVGGGSRPTPSKMKLSVSAPIDSHTLDRTDGLTGKWLGQGSIGKGPEVD